MSSTRSNAAKKSQKNDQNKKIAHSKYCETKVFLIDGKLIDDSRKDVEIISLRNPCTEEPARYLFAKHLSKFYEILSFSEEPRSWFINDMACTNGNLYMTTAFDPLFWGLYYIRLNCTKRCVPIEQAFIDENFSNTHLIGDALSVDQLSMIADQKGDKDLKAFKYNEEKTLKWLSIKCKKLMQEFQAKNFSIGAKSAYFVKTEKFENLSQNATGELLSYSFGIISEYISPDLSEKLSTHLGLEKIKPTTAGKRKSLGELEHTSLKRLKSEEDVNGVESKPIEAVRIVKEEKKVTNKEKQWAKAAGGTKNISAFFAKK